MSQFHIGVVKFYDGRKNLFGKIVPADLSYRERLFRFTNNDIFPLTYIPKPGDIVIYSSANGEREVIRIHDAINQELTPFPWKELLEAITANRNCISVDSDVVDLFNPSWTNGLNFGNLIDLLYAINDINDTNAIKTVYESPIKNILLSKCLDSQFVLYLDKDEKGYYFDVLESLFFCCVDSYDFVSVSKIIDNCDNISAEWFICIIKCLNDVLANKAEGLYQYIISLTSFEKIVKEKNTPADFRIEIYLTYALISGNTLRIEEHNILDESVYMNWLSSLSDADFLKLNQIIKNCKNQVIESYEFSFLDRFDSLLSKHSEDTIMVLQSIIGRVLSTEAMLSGKTASFFQALYKLDPVVFPISAPFYKKFSNDIKEIFITSLKSKIRPAYIFFNDCYDRSSIVNALRDDILYQKKHDLHIPSEVIDGTYREFEELRNSKIIFEFSDIAITKSIRNESPSAQLSLLNTIFPKPKQRNDFLYRHMQEDPITKQIADMAIESILTYVSKNAIVFDIEGIKSKGKGWEFAYNKNGEPHSEKAPNGEMLSDDAKWKMLEDAITSSSIIVGHNIKKWDYPLLMKRNKSFEENTQYLKNTWDTIEIELLLNPLRPSFALNAENGHIALNDVYATEKLFMQQLYAILESRTSYSLVKKYLPSEIVSLIDKNIDIIYAIGFSKHNVEEHNNLFYKPSIQDIPELEKYTSGSLLIVAEENAWQTVFNRFNARFYDDKNQIDEYNALDLKRIREDYRDSQNIYKRALFSIADNFISNKKRLNIHAIPKLIRSSINDKILRTYVSPETNPNVICVKPELVENFNSGFRFEKILVLCNTLIPHSTDIKKKNEQIIEIIEEWGEYSLYKKSFPVDITSLAKQGIKTEICREYWISQPTPKGFVLFSRFSKKEIIDTLKRKYSQVSILGDVGEDFSEEFKDNPPRQDEEDILNSVSLGKYWASKLESFKNIETQYPKILIVGTSSQAKSASKYLGIPYVLKKNIRKEFDKVQERNGYSIITVLQDLLDCDAYDLGAPFCFILIDNIFLSKQTNGDKFEQAKEQLLDRLSLFGNGSQLLSLDDFESNVAISGEQINKAEQCFCKDDKITLSKEDTNPLLEWIKKKNNIKSFRGLQEPAIKKVIEYDGPYKNFLTILPTGGGKSLIFQGPILYKAIKKHSKKLSLVITPLQALMENQVDELTKKRFNSSHIAYINANTPLEKKKKIIKSIRKHKVHLLYISPERLMDRHFFQGIIRSAVEDQGIDSIIFDEAHCITAWGMDFRSDYVLALRKCLELQKVHKDISIQMFTATLPWQAKEDLKAEFIEGDCDKLPECNILPNKDTNEYNASLCPIRDHIELQIIKKEAPKKEEAINIKLNAILEQLDIRAIDNLTSGRSRMIVFTYSRNDAEYAAKWFEENIHNDVLKKRVSYFHARVDKQFDKNEKDRRIRQFEKGNILILCSTKAFGLGMNIPNVHYTFHLTPPAFIEDYLQEVGRTARKTDEDYTPYTEAFPIVDGKREPVKAVCYYTEHDIQSRLDRIQVILWDDISDSFERIIEYVKDFKNSNHRYVIPINLLTFKENTYEETKTKSQDDDLVEKFQQCLGWLSKSNGLNRINLGFRCPDSYDLGYNLNNSGICEHSQLSKLIKHLKKTHVIQEDSSRIVIQANSIISNPSLGIDSVEELEFVIDEGVKIGVFNRDFMYISISLKNEEYLKSFIEGSKDELDVLSYLFDALTNRAQDPSLFDLNTFLEKNVENNESINNRKKKDFIKSVITESWTFFINLNIIYTAEEIKDNCIKLIRAVGSSKAESIKWSELANSINSKTDANKLKLFLFATSKLSYTTKGSSNTDFVEITIHNYEKLDENNDSKAKEEINNFYQNKQSRAGAMLGLIEDFDNSEKTKKFIREYSKCPTDKIDDLEIVAKSKKRLSAREGLKKAVAKELNAEQRAIYGLKANQNINVVAGAGSGKTRLLIYRALKLILAEGNKESRVLILAYNRAVRDEIEKRMEKYSSEIGYTMNGMKIFTFHGYASACIPDLQKNKIAFDEWEKKLLIDIKNNPGSDEHKYRHILIDEFQDVTTTRLEIIKSLLELNVPCNAFVIGDMFQSIYGYEKKKDENSLLDGLKPLNSIEPIDYYNRLNFSCKKYLTNNYRSYQAIINTAEQWFENMNQKYEELYKKSLPKLNSKLHNDEYTQEVDANGLIPCLPGDDWKGDFVNKVLTPFLNNRKQWTEKKHFTNTANPFSSIGILFRTNSDVQDAFQWLKEQEFINDYDIEVRVQGSDIFYPSTREFYFFKEKLNNEYKNTEASEDIVEKVCEDLITDATIYDAEVLNVARNLAKYIIEKNTDKHLSCADLVNKFVKFAGTERNRLKETLDGKQDVGDKLRIIVSTIHRVKGLEFDAVVIPSFKCSIGFGNEGLDEYELNMEERRLMYVAFSRAKRMLFWYKGEREEAIMNNKAYEGQNGLIYADDGQSKVDTAYLAISQKFKQNNYIKSNVKIGDEISLEYEKYNYNGEDRERVKIIHKNSHIGNLSRDNRLFSILKKNNKKNNISGYYVKSVNVFSFKDEENELKRWCEKAKNAGYVYYIDYYGCANI